MSEPIKQEVSGECKGVGDTDSNHGHSELPGYPDLSSRTATGTARPSSNLVQTPGLTTEHIGIGALTGRQSAASAQPV
jgi:hypothetical protein